MRQLLIRQAPSPDSPKCRLEPLEVGIIADVVVADLFVKIPL